MSNWQMAQMSATIVGAVFIPLAILLVGQRFTRQRARSEAEQRDVDRVALLLRHLSSDNPRERLLAIYLIKYLQDTKRFPKELLSAITFTAFSDMPDIAAAAQMVVGVSDDIPSDVVLNQLLAPLKVNLDRSKASFDRWRRQDLFLEEIIHDSNLFARDLLVTKSHMIPDDLMDAASQLVDHYNAWLQEYDRVRPNGVRDPNEPFVFVGVPPINKPFPTEAAEQFLDRFKKLARQ